MINFKNKSVHISLVLLLLTGCIGAASHNEKLTGRFYLLAIDDMSDMTVCHLDSIYRIGIIPSTVFAVGYNDKYIIAKQHPEELTKIDKSITNYYIIPIKNVQYYNEKDVIGPMTKDSFENKRKELGVPETLSFTKVFKELE